MVAKMLTYVLCVLCILHATPVESLKNYNYYDSYYIEDDCNPELKNVYFLQRSGLGSVVEVRTKKYFNNDFDCNVTIQAPMIYNQFGVILRVITTDFGYSFGDYLEIDTGTGLKTKIRGYAYEGSTFISAKTTVNIKYFRKNSFGSFLNKGVKLVATAFTNYSGLLQGESFRCKDGRYIYSRLTCDGVKNCADSSDEANSLCDDTAVIDDLSFYNSNSFPYWLFPILAIALFLFVLSVFLKRYCRYRHLSTDTSQTTTHRPPSGSCIAIIPSSRAGRLANATNTTAHNEFLDMPPPYFISKEETASKQVQYSNPPPYQSVHVGNVQSGSQMPSEGASMRQRPN